MEEITSQLLRPGTVAVAVAVVIATFFIRKIVETVFPVVKAIKHKEQPDTYLGKMGMWWNTVILYAIPVVLGGLTAFFNSDFLHGDIKDFGGRLLFQAGVGWFSSFIYKILRKLILKKTGVDIQPGPVKPES